MSIMTPHLVSRKAKPTKPAVIRPVPATFAAGLFDDDEALPAEFVARMAQIESEEADWDREFSRVHHGKPFTRKPYPVTDASLDAARRFGHRLGYGGNTLHASIVHNSEERQAFVQGYNEGTRDRDRDDMLSAVAWCAEREHLYDGSDEPWGDGAEHGSAVGHWA